MQISGHSAPDLFCTDASHIIDWDVACWKSDVGTTLIKNWSKLAGGSLKIHVITVHWFAWLQFGVLRTCLASLKSIILFLSGGNNLIRVH